MKIGDKFIAKYFNSTHDKSELVYFNEIMQTKVGLECTIIDASWREFDEYSDFVGVRFNDYKEFSWLKSALKPI